VAAGISVPRTSGEDASVPPGIYIITPGGKLLGRIPILEDVITNLAFGGPERKTLYVTSGKSIFTIPLAVPGYALDEARLGDDRHLASFHELFPPRVVSSDQFRMCW